MSVNQLEFNEEYGYMDDTEPKLRAIGAKNKSALSWQAANQIRHLKENIRELVSIIEIHSNATNKNFAWAELEEAKKAMEIFHVSQ